MNKRENHPNTLKNSGQCRGNTVFSNGRLLVSISPFFGRVLISKSLHPRSFIHHNHSFLPSLKRLFCILFLLLINYWFISLQKCSPKVEVAIDKLSLCEVSQGSLAFQEKNRAFKLWGSDKRWGQYLTAGGSFQHCTITLCKVPACQLISSKGPSSWRVATYEADWSTDTGCWGSPIQDACTHPCPFHHCSHIHLLPYEDTAFLKAQFIPFFFCSQRLKIALFNDLNNLEPMNKSFAQEVTLALLFLLIVSHQPKWPLSRSQHWHPLISWFLRE